MTGQNYKHDKWRLQNTWVVFIFSARILLLCHESFLRYWNVMYTSKPASGLRWQCHKGGRILQFRNQFRSQKCSITSSENLNSLLDCFCTPSRVLEKEKEENFFVEHRKFMDLPHTNVFVAVFKACRNKDLWNPRVRINFLWSLRQTTRRGLTDCAKSPTSNSNSVNRCLFTVPARVWWASTLCTGCVRVCQLTALGWPFPEWRETNWCSCSPWTRGRCLYWCLENMGTRNEKIHWADCGWCGNTVWNCFLSSFASDGQKGEGRGKKKVGRVDTLCFFADRVGNREKFPLMEPQSVPP